MVNYFSQNHLNMEVRDLFQLHVALQTQAYLERIIWFE